MHFLQAIIRYFSFTLCIKALLLIFGLKSKNTPSPAPNLKKIKPISLQICKFFHFSIPRHIHNKRLPWKHLRLMRIVFMCKMTPIGVRLNLTNFILKSCAVMELLRKVSQGAQSPPDEMGFTPLDKNWSLHKSNFTFSW